MQPTLPKLLAAAAVLAGCGNNHPATDASVHHDGGNPDAPSFPAPPALGSQIDRMGRPGVGTMLIGAFASEPSRTAIRTAYSQASDPATWKTTLLPNNVMIEREIEVNLSVYDAVDIGMTPLPGKTADCANALRYDGPPKATSYQPAGDLLADDRIYVDTSRATCPIYFALEIEFGSFGMVVHNTCGGRSPVHDVVDMTYSVLAAGVLAGVDLTNVPTPRIHDGAAAHSDVVMDTFPFLGPPH